MSNERFKKGRGGRKVERKGQQQGPVEKNKESRRTAERQTTSPTPTKGKGEEQGAYKMFLIS